MIPVLIESALRALVVALTVWAGLRLFRVGHVAAQKIAWGLVLACAAAMPMAMRWPGLQGLLTVRVPATLWRTTAKPSPAAEAAGRTVNMTVNRAANGTAIRAVNRMAATPDVPLAKSSSPIEPALGPGDRYPAPVISASQFSAVPSERTVESLPAASATPMQDALRNAVLRLERPETLAGMLYLAVCAILLMRMIYGLAMAVRLWLTAERFEPEPGPDPLRDPGLGLRLRFSFAVSSPVTIGSGVLLPADCLGWDREKLRIVLAHERAHVRQGDFYLQLAAGLYAAVFWFSPLGWWLKRTLTDLGEAISDRAGLEQAASRVSYAQVLLEFAALPRPTLTGVAMARNSNLSQRMERFLNESSFRRAFTGGRRRMLLAVLLVPIALFAGTALVRVEAASGQAVQIPPVPAGAPNPASAPAPALAPVLAPALAAAPSAPQAADDQAPALAAPTPDLAAPAPDPAPAPQAVPVPPAAPNAAPAAAPEPPAPAEIIHDADDDNAVIITDSQDNSATNTNTISNGKHLSTSVGHGYSYSYSSDGDSWALVTDPSDRVTFSGDWHNSTRDELNKARKLAGGKFLWFTHDGKSYFLDDPAVMAQIQEMYKPMEELGRQQEILGKQQEALGREQEEMGRKQEQASIPTPDISNEMARLNEAVARLDAKKGSTVSERELADIEGRLGEIEGRLGRLQGEVGAKQGELGAVQGKLGEEQGRLGSEQGRLGAQQGTLAAEADKKVKSIIDESLRDGKAKPVE
jgi:hypothetical protein